MSSFEERLSAVEHAVEKANADNKREHEMLTIAINSLLSKESFEKINEQNGKLFDALRTHDMLTNTRLGDIQGQLIEQDGKIVGWQTEMRQRFAEQDNKITVLDGKVVGLQTEMRQRMNEQDKKITALDDKVTQHTTLLNQILALLQQRS